MLRGYFIIDLVDLLLGPLAKQFVRCEVAAAQTLDSNSGGWPTTMFVAF